MALVSDIWETYHAPRSVMRRQLDSARSEERALGLLMGASALMYLSRIPPLIRDVAEKGADAPPLAGLAAATFVATMIFGPLFLYLLAAISHLVARIFGGQGGWLDARLALFWSLLALSPFVLIRGGLVGFLGQSLLVSILSIAMGIAFFVIWWFCLQEAEKVPASA